MMRKWCDRFWSAAVSSSLVATVATHGSPRVGKPSCLGHLLVPIWASPTHRGIHLGFSEFPRSACLNWRKVVECPHHLNIGHSLSWILQDFVDSCHRQTAKLPSHSSETSAAPLVPRVIACMNGTECLEYLDGDNPRPRLLLLDSMGPAYFNSVGPVGGSAEVVNVVSHLRVQVAKFDPCSIGANYCCQGLPWNVRNIEVRHAQWQI